MKRKALIEGEYAPEPRSSQVDWNLQAELHAFKCRLDIESVADNVLMAAFTEPITTDATDFFENYNGLLANGNQFLKEFLTHYLQLAVPLLPDEGRSSVISYLLDAENIATVAYNLGYEDLIQCKDFPPSPLVLSNSFKASVGAILMSQGPLPASRFILDFVVPLLVGKDIIHDIWNPHDPMTLLADECRKQSIPEPVARLSRQSSVRTVMPLFFVCLFSGETFLAESGAESVPRAEEDAAKIALKNFYKVDPTHNPLPLGIRVQPEFLEKLFRPLLTEKKFIEDPDTPAATSDVTH